ncbi:prephenate dehydrogenase/arogenate dehydrogenase family protein [Wenzhouxiangella marina]|uniref:Chorismate mutase n=1 Tax=Wenzhouxiangella marina TaxID=1579979 RepID=A0A0K0XV92_9GAMM|nr:prephenate dehydrogenase/arogenate dehydrogenase family protein [Wenzhouxiangella marina]AKS41598.1 Chorismate mutase [Wenzhouxiangella marina]MBB6086643.1 chorismate mutase/prephenate dehydrogenase [Wenzhouxiangella marina]
MSKADRTPESIEALRKRLDSIDATLVTLAAERQRIVSEIGRSKQSEGRQLRDFRREREVLDHVRARALSEGLDPELAEDLLKRLIEASLTRQEQERGRLSGRGSGRRALVIGAAGRLGRWLSAFLDNQGFDLLLADPSYALDGENRFRDWRDAPKHVDLVVLATPIAVTAELLEALAAAGHPGLVIDVASIKSPLIGPLRRATAAGLSVCSVHPMFGPSTQLLSGRHVLFMDVGCPAAVDQAEALFSETMAELKRIDIEQHDRLIAWVLGLSHALNIAFFSALAESGVPAEELASLSSTTFDRQLAIARDVASESPELYFEIQRLNEHGAVSREALSSALKTLTERLAQDDEAGFRRLMLQGRDYLEKL